MKVRKNTERDKETESERVGIEQIKREKQVERERD